MRKALDVKRAAANLERLLRICRRRGRILALIQDNPDPDAIASAAAFREIVRTHLRKRVVIGYGGELGRAENRAMVHELGIDIRRVTPADLYGFAILCLFDTQPRSGNNALLTSRQADIVIDHHVRPRRLRESPGLVDIRPGYGATATILYEYLLAAGIKPAERLASALYYGIETDTETLGRQACEADIEAFRELVPVADKRKLARIRRAPVDRDYFAVLHDSLSNAFVAGKTVVTLVRESNSRDTFAEVAELLLRLEGIRTSVCYGPCGNTIYLSARAADARGNVAARMRRVVSRLGTGGGHRSMAGGQIPFTSDLEKRLNIILGRILKHFAGCSECHPLLPR